MFDHEVKQQLIYNQPVDEHLTETLRDVYRRLNKIWIPGTPDPVTIHTLATIKGELYKRCRYCGEKREAHAASGKCLFESTYFKHGARP